MKIGIDKIGLSVPNTYVDLKELEIKRNIPINKITQGLMQEKMAFSSDLTTQDLAYLSAKEVVNNTNIDKIDYVIFATESSNDLSKAMSISIISKLKLSPFTRTIEIKQACYSSTSALNIAYNYILANENSKVLIIASDISKYGLNSKAESTQGAGSIAMIISKDPEIAEILPNNITYTQDIYDFYRPINEKYPVVDGVLSQKTYVDFFDKVFTTYNEKFKMKLDDYKAICMHVPYGKLPYKVISSLGSNILSDNFLKSLEYNKQIGNVYTASLYLNFLSLLNQKILKKDDLVGMYSYGSGATAEFYILKIVDTSKVKSYSEMLNNRKKLEIKDYEKNY